MGGVWNVLIESCGVTKSPVSQCNSKFDLHPGPMVWQIILNDSPHKRDQLLLEKVQLFAARLAIKSWSQDQTSLFTMQPQPPITNEP